MKITRISSVVVNARMRNWIFVKVETDQQGLYGWGEATLEWKTKGVVGAVEDIGRLLCRQLLANRNDRYRVAAREHFSDLFEGPEDGFRQRDPLTARSDELELRPLRRAALQGFQ